jgi:polyisoprenoid-binding protein YceI
MRLFLAAVLATAAVPAIAQAPAGLPGSPNAAAVTAGTYAVDPAHTQVTWTLNHMGFSMLSGQFGAEGGSLTIDPKRPAAAKLDVTFAIPKLSTTSEQFKHHLESKDFFDAATYPTARFVSTSVVANGSRAKITGNLTIKNVTKPVTIDATFVGAGTNPMSKKLNFGFRGTAMIKRSDFGLGYAAPVVADDVKLDINAAFTAQ